MREGNDGGLLADIRAYKFVLCSQRFMRQDWQALQESPYKTHLDARKTVWIVKCDFIMFFCSFFVVLLVQGHFIINKNNNVFQFVFYTAVYVLIYIILPESAQISQISPHFFPSKLEAIKNLSKIHRQS